MRLILYALCVICDLIISVLKKYAGYEATIRTEDIGYGVFKTVTGLGTTYLVYKGATIGAELGTFVCPGFGTFVGGFLGGLAGEYLGQKITSIAESKLFPDINSNSDVFLSK